MTAYLCRINPVVLCSASKVQSKDRLEVTEVNSDLFVDSFTLHTQLKHKRSCDPEAHRLRSIDSNPTTFRLINPLLVSCKESGRFRRVYAQPGSSYPAEARVIVSRGRRGIVLLARSPWHGVILIACRLSDCASQYSSRICRTANTPSFCIVFIQNQVIFKFKTKYIFTSFCQ